MVPSENGRATSAIALPWGLAWRLAIGQIFSWGILYYAFTVVVGPMQSATGWSRTFLNSGLSLGLLAWGLCAYPVGWWIQRRGARELMAVASVAGGGGLLLMGFAPAPAAYLAAWLLLGAAMAGLLYDPAFAVVTAAFGAHYRRGITFITLVGGLASTVFIPLAQLAVDRFGWRMALGLLGGVQIAVCFPLHAWGIPAMEQRVARGAQPASARLLEWWRTFCADVTDRRFVGLALWFTAHSAAFTGLVFQIIPVLQTWHVPDGTIITAIAFMGPMQVAGRLFLSARGERFATLHVGVFAMGMLIAAMLLLIFLPPTLLTLALFMGAMGLGNGMLTIVRGISVAEWFGRERYAEINGALAAPGVLARAASPLMLAALWSATHSARAVPLAAFLILLGGCGGLLLLSRERKRGGLRSVDPTVAEPATLR